MMPEINAIDVTYSELRTVLESLNFKKTASKYFRYINEKFDAEVLLPKGKDNDLVNKANYLAMTFILAGKGILKNRKEMNQHIQKLQKENAAKKAAPATA